MTLISNLISLNSYIPDSKSFWTEKKFTWWLNKKIRDAWWFAFKISDADARYKPWDCIYAWWWESALVEIKYTKHSSCYPYRMLKWSSATKVWRQVAWLSLHAKNGWKSLVLVYSEKENCFKIIDFRELSAETKISFKS